MRRNDIQYSDNLFKNDYNAAVMHSHAGAWERETLNPIFKIIYRKFAMEPMEPLSKANILLVDDEYDILHLIEYNLKKEGYSVALADSGEKALTIVKRENPDLIVLDLMLPGIDGLEVCKILKSDPATRRIPVLMLTAKAEESDIVIGLELGADDYLPKPFSPKVLTARVKALLRRTQAWKSKNSGDVLKTGGLTIHPELHKVTIGEESIDLTATEFDILHLLVKRRGWVFSRAQIVDNVKGDDYPVTDRSVDFHMVSLRRKLGGYGKRIETVRGVGYRFKGDDI